MEGILKKLKKAGFADDAVQEVSFEVSWDMHGPVGNLRIGGDSPIYGSIKHIKLSYLSAETTSTPEVILDDMLNFIVGDGISSTNSIFTKSDISPKMAETEVAVATTPPPPPPSPPSAPPVKEPVTNSMAGISLPPMFGGNGNKIVTPSTNQAPPVVEDTLPPPPPKKEGGIRDVQMLAIQAILKLKKIEYNELITATFTENGFSTENIPAIEKLTEEQALEVIRYGNNKYKK